MRMRNNGGAYKRRSLSRRQHWMAINGIVRVGGGDGGVFLWEGKTTNVHRYGCRKSTEVYELIRPR